MDAGQAENDVEVLKNHDIQFEIEDNSRPVQEIFLGMDTAPTVLLKLFQEDFLKANELLLSKANDDIASAESDYYLYSFEDDELLEIVAEQDSWSAFDVQLSKKILSGRGIPISTSLEKAMKEKRIKDLSKKENNSSIWTTFGYISAFLGGILGIAIGLSLWKGKRILPNGSKVFIYHDDDRLHGMYITFIGIIMFLSLVIMQIFLY
ncbi:MAG: hypothetical protein A2W93_00325 [Bacteroidetes bacterium GWF2_43_63]|nr:MAG: hypothetical protein A2W94_13195 [Bacteroidetes bacterium GWE2_42_42]OFY53851.1 MAG: hypothetical protein A2W93_00325 [Bacteroidetes bacterium GWF2_43_63]HBG69809.1 hypothetical protein [Bacteroidales bacterium]HCB60993.1 hypothetical protein [Bacteroidales bacterium]HCY24549.1 hypothetical protein [Bacteroidales bacterium]